MARLKVPFDEVMLAAQSAEGSVNLVADLAGDLVTLAGDLGVTLRIDVQPDPAKPLAMGNVRHVVEAWLARHGVPKVPA